LDRLETVVIFLQKNEIMLCIWQIACGYFFWFTDINISQGSVAAWRVWSDVESFTRKFYRKKVILKLFSMWWKSRRRTFWLLV